MLLTITVAMILATERKDIPANTSKIADMVMFSTLRWGTNDEKFSFLTQKVTS